MQSTQHIFFNDPGEGDTTAIDPLFIELRAAIANGLRPNLQRIHVNAEYPEAFMRRIGALGAFKQGTPAEFGGTGKGLKWTIKMMEEIAQECLNTGFLMWCQTVCAWYIQNGESQYLKEQILPKIITGEILAGTGMSNPMKHFAGIEQIRITAQRGADGYILNGSIPMVSNMGEDHYFGIVAKNEEEASYLMAVLPGNLPGLSIGDVRGFIALDGSSTCSCKFKDVFVPTQYILASPCNEFVARIRSGFILTQTGFGLGLVSSCIELMKRTNRTKGHINCFLDDQAEDIETALRTAQRCTYALAEEIGCGDRDTRADIVSEVVQARLSASELALRASQASMLHAGASGYRLNGVYDKKLREAYFVAIVTPALKHLKKLLYDLQHV
jgi:alkylation response protein AidB-like acyl-CoA dehydrogenase